MKPYSLAEFEAEDAKRCTDCGTRHVWWYSHQAYCRICHDKNGHSCSVKVDPDKVLSMFKSMGLVATPQNVMTFLAHTERDG